MKTLIIPDSLKLIDKTMDLADAYLVGLKGLSVNMNLYLTVEEIEKLLKNCDKELFVAINKNMHNSDLENLKNSLDRLLKLNIKGIFYYDMAVYNLCSKKEKLVWSMEHATTNYATINYFNKLGVTKVYLSSEITLDEIKEIRNKTNSTIFVNVFGFLPIFLSKRYLISNYKNYFNLKDNDTIYYMEKENKRYPLLETDDGTIVYNSSILNAYDDYDELSIVDYTVFNSFLIDNDDFVNILKSFINKENKDKIDMLLKYNTDDGFMHKKTIYKVVK